MTENSIRRAAGKGRAAFGTGIKESASRGIPGIIEASGFDYCMMNHEHGAFDLHRVLDQGMIDIRISEVEDLEEARAVAREAKHSPLGNRGISGWGIRTGYRGYRQRYAFEYEPWANAKIMLRMSIGPLEVLKLSRRSPPRRASI